MYSSVDAAITSNDELIASAATSAALTSISGTQYVSVDAAIEEGLATGVASVDITADNAGSILEAFRQAAADVGVLDVYSFSQSELVTAIQVSNDGQIVTEDTTPFSHADIDAMAVEATAAALTSADGTTHASVDAAITSNDTTIETAALTTSSGVVFQDIDTAIVSNDLEVFSSAKTEALTALDGTIFATVDAAFVAGVNSVDITSNDEAVRIAALTASDGTVYNHIDDAVANSSTSGSHFASLSSETNSYDSNHRNSEIEEIVFFDANALPDFLSEAKYFVDETQVCHEPIFADEFSNVSLSNYFNGKLLNGSITFYASELSVEKNLPIGRMIAESWYNALEGNWYTKIDFESYLSSLQKPIFKKDKTVEIQFLNNHFFVSEKTYGYDQKVPISFDTLGNNLVETYNIKKVISESGAVTLDRIEELKFELVYTESGEIQIGSLIAGQISQGDQVLFLKMDPSSNAEDDVQSTITQKVQIAYSDADLAATIEADRIINLTSSDGVVYSSVDAAITSNDELIASAATSAALTSISGTQYVSVDAAIEEGLATGVASVDITADNAGSILEAFRQAAADVGVLDVYSFSQSELVTAIQVSNDGQIVTEDTTPFFARGHRCYGSRGDCCCAHKCGRNHACIG